MKRIEKVRLHPTPQQEARLQHILHCLRHLYNAALQERRDAYKMRRVCVSAKMQYHELTALRKDEPGCAAIYRECQDAILHRLDLAFAAFFRRVKAGNTPGFPRFKSAARFSQVEFPHGDRALTFNAPQTKVRVPGVGSIRLRKGRAVPEHRGRAWIVLKNGRWHACFECEREVTPLPATGVTLGIDRGVHVLAATSDGVLHRNNRHADKLKYLVTKHARTLDALTIKDALGRCMNRRDPTRIRAAQVLARTKEREANARHDALHKLSRTLVNGADILVLEKLALARMTRSARGTKDEPGRNVAAKHGLNRAMLDAGFGLLHTMLCEKAAEAVRTVVLVDARFSSQECARCGHIARESRRRRRFECVACGFTCHADVNAALVIRGRAQLGARSVLSSGSARLQAVA